MLDQVLCPELGSSVQSQLSVLCPLGGQTHWWALNSQGDMGGLEVTVPLIGSVHPMPLRAS